MLMLIHENIKSCGIPVEKPLRQSEKLRDLGQSPSVDLTAYYVLELPIYASLSTGITVNLR